MFENGRLELFPAPPPPLFSYSLLVVALRACSVVLDSVTPWIVAIKALHGDFQGKNTGVGCHFLLQSPTSAMPQPFVRPGYSSKVNSLQEIYSYNCIYTLD